MEWRGGCSWKASHFSRMGGGILLRRRVCMLIMTQVLVPRPSSRPLALSVMRKSRCASSLPSSWNQVLIWMTSPLQGRPTRGADR